MQLKDDSDDESLHIGRVNELGTDKVRFIKEAHSCLYKEATHDNVKRSSVPVVAEGWGGMHFVARAPTKKPAKFYSVYKFGL